MSPAVSSPVAASPASPPAFETGVFVDVLQVGAALRDKADAENRAEALSSETRNLRAEIARLRAERAALRAEVRRRGATPFDLIVQAAHRLRRSLRRGLARDKMDDGVKRER